MSLVLGIMFSFLLITTGIVFSQEQAQQNPPTQVTQPTQEIPSEPEAQWIWGEAVSIDTVAKKILVKYLDYETDAEKEINIEVDDKTTYENVNSVDEIKPQDTLSIDYMVSPEGSNIARNISVEKPEGAQTLPEESIKEEPSKEEPSKEEPSKEEPSKEEPKAVPGLE